MSKRNRIGNNPVQVENVMFVTETEKSYGIVPIDKIEKGSAAQAVENVKDARRMTDEHLIWIPKSQIKEVKTEACEVFPHLRVKYPSKINPENYPFKMKMSFQTQLWLAADKKLGYQAPGAPSQTESAHNDAW